MSPEVAAPRIDGDARMLATILSRGAGDVPPGSWERIVRRAVDERMAPLLFWRLRGDGSVPPRYRDELRSELYRTEARSLLLYRALGRLLERGAAAGLPAPILLKGGALATSLYEEIGLRPMSDVDVLVRREALHRWIEIAREASFRRVQPEMALGLTEAVHFQVGLAHGSDAAAVVELHFGLVAGDSDWRSPDLGWFFEHAEPWPPPRAAGPHLARQLDPTAHLLYLAAHAMLQHGAAQARLIWFHDLHLLASRRRDDILWTELVSKGRELRWNVAVSRALSRARALFDTSLPDGLIEELESEADEGSRGFLERRSDPGMSRAELVWSELRSVGPGRRARWAVAILFPRPEYMKWRYPRAGFLWPLCYIHRWARVAWEGSRALAGKVRRTPPSG